MRRYGITLQGRDEILRKQNFKCAVCDSPTPSSRKGWVVDHCHNNKKIRGILCQSCNLALGHSKEDIQRLRSLIRYIKKHNK